MPFELLREEDELVGETLELYQSTLENLKKQVPGMNVTLVHRQNYDEKLVRIKAISSDPDFVYIQDPDSAHSELTPLSSILRSKEVKSLLENLLQKSNADGQIKRAVKSKILGD